MRRSEPERLLSVTQLPIDLQMRLRDGTRFTPIGRMHRDWLFGGAIVIGTMLAAIGVLSAARTELFSRPSHLLAVAGAALAGAMIGNHARRDQRRSGFELLGVDGTSILLITRDRIRVIPAEQLQVTAVGDSLTLSIDGNEVVQVAVDAVTKTIGDAAERARDPQQVAQDRWRLAPVGLPALESTWSPVLIGGLAAVGLTLGASAALSASPPDGVSWNEVGEVLAEFDQVERDVLAVSVAEGRLDAFIEQHRADLIAHGSFVDWVARDENAILAAVRHRRDRLVRAMRDAGTIPEVHRYWRKLRAYEDALDEDRKERRRHAVHPDALKALRRETDQLEPEVDKLSTVIVEREHARAKGLVNPRDQLTRLLAIYREGNQLAVANDLLPDIRRLIDARLLEHARDLDELLALADEVTQTLAQEQRRRLWIALTALVPTATRVSTLARVYEHAYVDSDSDRSIQALQARARRLWPADIEATYRALELPQTLQSILHWDDNRREVHKAAALRETIEAAVALEVPVRELAARLRKPDDFVILLDALDDDEAEGVVKVVANQRANREPDLKSALTWADAARAHEESVERWRCGRMFPRSASLPASQQLFYQTLAITLCENESQELVVEGDIDSPDDLALAAALARKLVRIQNLPQLEGKLVDRFEASDVTIVRDDGPCRIELVESDPVLAIPCAGGMR